MEYFRSEILTRAKVEFRTLSSLFVVFCLDFFALFPVLSSRLASLACKIIRSRGLWLEVLSFVQRLESLELRFENGTRMDATWSKPP